MFNLYIYEKRLKDKELQEKIEIEKKKRYDLHAKHRDKLAKNFHQKTNKFILEMIRKPIIIKNAYYQQKEKKTNNSFCLYKFETDKERLSRLLGSSNKYLTEKCTNKRMNRCQSNYLINNKNNIYQDNNFNKAFNNMNNNDLIEEDKMNINQPSMKFKPRNDLERIIESINKNKGIYLKNNKYDVTSKSKNVKFDLSQKNGENVKKDSNLVSDKDNNNFNGLIVPYNNQIYNIKKSEKKIQILKEDNKILNDKINLSNKVKNITEKYHSKTYFNSIKQDILYNNKNKKIFQKDNHNKKILKKPKNIKMNYSSSAINLFSKIKNDNYKMEIKTSRKEKEKYAKKDINNEVLDLSLEEIDKNKILQKIYKLNNPIFDEYIFNNLKTDIIPNDALIVLKKLSTNKQTHKTFSSERRQSQLVTEDKNGFLLDYDISTSLREIKNLKSNKKDTIIEDEKYIIINNTIYNKTNKNDMKNLGNMALKKCHFINTKYDDNKNNNLKRGEGKLMITNGLSLNVFLDKYSLPNFRK